MSRDILVVTAWRGWVGLLLASRLWRTGTLLNIPQFTDGPPKQRFIGSKIPSSVKVRKPDGGVVNVALFYPKEYFEKMGHNKEYMIQSKYFR